LITVKERRIYTGYYHRYDDKLFYVNKSVGLETPDGSLFLYTVFDSCGHSVVTRF